MDLINDSIELDKSIENVTSKSKRDLKEIIDKIHKKPHGLFYQTEKNHGAAKTSPIMFSNVSFDMTTTEISSTILDWVYDDNVSTTEESWFSTASDAISEENVTELTLFEKTTETPKLKPKKVVKENKCDCNILYKTCDINCCCDSDCSDSEKSLFLHNCDAVDCPKLNNRILIHSCYLHEACVNKIPTSFLENLFFISKTNLPEKRLTDIQFDEAAIYRNPKWHISERQEALHEFKNTAYKYTDPIWLLHNDSIFYADIPMTTNNNYCNGMKPIQFLINENIQCIVKLEDLYMFHIMKLVDKVNVLSVIQTGNETVKNETSFYNTNWTLMICDVNECLAYNRSRDEPQCTDTYCTNIATTIHFNFYYFHSKITKAVIKLYVEKLPLDLPFISQAIHVKFLLTNESADNIIELSGNPGYIWNLPVIISRAESNHTFNFFNDTSALRILKFPENKNGLCLLSRNYFKTLRFGQNTRNKCRFQVNKINNFKNGTSSCQLIQSKIFDALGINSTFYISPYGNPENVPDENWIRPSLFEKTFVYGHFRRKNTELACYNIVTRIGFVVAYGVVNGENKILFVKIEGTAQNITFVAEEAWAVLAVDTRFVDASAPRAPEYAGAPHLSLHLPRGFFLPNKGNEIHHIFILYLCPIIIQFF